MNLRQPQFVFGLTWRKGRGSQQAPEAHRVRFRTNATEAMDAWLSRLVETRDHLRSVDAATNLIWVSWRTIARRWERYVYDGI